MDKNSGDIDWMQLTKAERVVLIKDLYQAVRGVADLTSTTVVQLIDQALQGLPAVGTDYESNFRRGNIAAAKAALIHRWLEENHFDLARTFAPDLFQTNPKSAWELFIDAKAATGRLSVVQLKSNAGLIERDDQLLEVGETLRLTQRFCFELRSELKGVALAFQKYNHEWHNLPLGADSRNLKGSVTDSPQVLPHDKDGKPIGLRENNDTGQHEFVIVVSEDRKLPTDMNKLAQLGEDGERVEVHRIAVRFVT